MIRRGRIKRWDIGYRWRWSVVLSVGTSASVTDAVNEYKSLRWNKASGTILVAPRACRREVVSSPAGKGGS